MLIVLCGFLLALYLFFLVDWKMFRGAFSQGGWVVLGIYCLIAVAYVMVKAHIHTGGAMHH
jgi:hypothetical protein